MGGGGQSPSHLLLDENKYILWKEAIFKEHTKSTLENGT